MARSVADAWSLEPLGVLRLGEREHPIPPLTFGRFQRLVGSEPHKAIGAIVGNGASRKQTRVEWLMERALRWSIRRAPRLTRHLWWIVDRFGLGQRRVPVPEVAPIVSICVPTVTEAEWKLHGTSRHVVDLFLMFGRAHDWAAIADAIRFGEPPEPGEEMPDRTQIVAGLLAVAKATGYTVEALHAMRVDGFYLLVESLRGQRERGEPEETVLPPGVTVQGGDETGLLEKLRAAEHG